MPGKGRPLITANQVTLARLIPMPLLAWLLYEGNRVNNDTYLWGALIAGTLIGCTDWVDGMLARRHGPTVLGGLLDPIADKVFIGFAYTPFADSLYGVGLIPWWACALMFTREFFITALRSAYEQRALTLKTSYLAKVKTWTQMQGIGVLLLIKLVSRDTMTVLIAIGIVLPLLAMGGLYLVKKRFWPGALVMSGSFVALVAVHLWGDQQLTLYFIMMVIVALTWASGFDYLFSGLRHLRGRGDFGRADAVRLIGSLALPALIFAVLIETSAPGWPLLAILSLELAVGGLDNLASHHQRASGALPWGSRVLGASALLAGALLWPSMATWLSVVAAAVSFAGVTWEFWRGRDLYLDRRVRDEALRDRPVPTTSPS